MRRKPGSRLREIFTGWTGLDWFWLTLLVAGAIGAGVLDTRGTPRVASEATAPAIVPIVWEARPPARSEGPAEPALAGATDANHGNKAAHTVAASIRTAAQSHTGRSPVPEPPRPATPTRALSQLAMANPARSEGPAGPALSGATAADAANSEAARTGAASVPTAPQFQTGRPPLPERSPPSDPIRALPQVAMANPAASSAVPEDRVEEDRTNSAALAVGRERVVIHYLAGSPAADAVAKRLSKRLGVPAEMREEQTAPQSALILYGSSDDHSAAREAGKILGEMDYAWKIQTDPNHTGASSQRVITIWLPNR